MCSNSISVFIMHKLNILLSLCTLFYFSSCSTNPESNSENKISGRWQNIETPEMGIEFDKNGIYHLLKNKKRQTIQGMGVMEYTYNPSMENNLKITEKSSDLISHGRLQFLNDDEIKISLKVAKSYSADARYTRIKD